MATVSWSARWIRLSSCLVSSGTATLDTMRTFSGSCCSGGRLPRSEYGSFTTITRRCATAAARVSCGAAAASPGSWHSSAICAVTRSRPAACSSSVVPGLLLSHLTWGLLLLLGGPGKKMTLPSLITFWSLSARRHQLSTLSPGRGPSRASRT